MQVDETVILDLASSELEFFRSLKELILRAAQNINSENMEELMVVLQEKQEIISRYDIIWDEWNNIGLSLGIKDGRNNPDFWVLLFQMLPGGSSEKSLCSVKLKSLLEQSKVLVEELLKTEDDAQEVLNEYVERLRARISQVSKGRNACKGYASAGGSSFSGR